MKVTAKEKSVILEDVKDFNITHIFECGQCFRWDRVNENSFVGVVGDKVISVSQNGDIVEFNNATIEDYNNFWKHYFDMERDYSDIKDDLKADKTLNEAIKFGWGIRILNQDIWECLISFIISANNRIPMIKRAVKNISKMYGRKLVYDNKEYYTFPTPAELKDASIEDLEACGAGFRAKYIKKTVEIVLASDFNLYSINHLSTQEAREKLQILPGVGPKIADCVLLFSVQKYDAFPTDVWVKRVMEYFYSDTELKLSKIQSMAGEMFGELAGFAQQYLFYYARELKIGK